MQGRQDKGGTILLVSTKGRYALRVMLDLARYGKESQYIPLKDIAKRQEISEKYLESIISSLSRAKLVTGVRGKKGGYKLTRDPETYTVKDIIELTDKPTAPVSCLADKENECPRAAQCETLEMWQRLDQMIGGYLERITLDDLLKGNLPQVVFK